MNVGRKNKHPEPNLSAAESYALEAQTIAELRARARKKYISGRSSMSRTELIQALKQV